jgi:hypothetical protein
MKFVEMLSCKVMESLLVEVWLTVAPVCLDYDCFPHREVELGQEALVGTWARASLVL